MKKTTKDYIEIDEFGNKTVYKANDINKVRECWNEYADEFGEEPSDKICAIILSYYPVNMVVSWYWYDSDDEGGDTRLHIETSYDGEKDYYEAGGRLYEIDEED